MLYVRIIVLTTLVLSTFGASSQEADPRIKKDGFPAGKSTPEGAATDLARAFIQRDADLFLRTSIPPFGGGQSRAAYAQYLTGQSDTLRRERAKRTYSRDNPKAIKHVFAARHLSLNGPASYGYAAFDFQDVMFVDVEVILNDDASYVKRTLVIQANDGNWYAYPKPELSPLLSMGLDSETPSIKIVAASK